MAEQPVLDGVITFYNSSQAMRAERLLKKAAIPCMSIPGPREISANCGVAVAFDYIRLAEVQALLNSVADSHETVHHYPEARKVAKWL
ncbi:MAG: DUF3343 domain-containing protein [Planctomycetes bacterium]|nr:DUF3343 domain-containing protein [Planctomycetota bacterium]